jgi:AcrR family transcriptional regulator
MGRQRQPQIRQRLLDACTDYALEHGLPDRLGPFAAATGTSNRMLIYHFGTRDGLLREVLGRARERQVKLDRNCPSPDSKPLTGASRCTANRVLTVHAIGEERRPQLRWHRQVLLKT